MLCDNELSFPVSTTFLKLSTIALFFPPKIKLTRVVSLVSLGRATTQNGKKRKRRIKRYGPIRERVIVYGSSYKEPSLSYATRTHTWTVYDLCSVRGT